MTLCFLSLENKRALLQHGSVYPIEIQRGFNDLFDREEVLHIKLSGNIRVLMNDREDNAAYHPIVLTYKGMDGNEVSLNIKAKTRGHFRRKKENCSMPPILLNFNRKESGTTLFKEQDKLKLVTPCQDDNYVIREYLVYKLYNLITPKSYKARLVRVMYQDTEKNKAYSSYGILVEEDEQMAKRNGLKILKGRMIQGEHTEPETFIKMAFFQYLIGNTDWSVPYRHNIRIIAFDSLSVPYTVPYDFDHAGIVNASYALPPEELGLRSTQERRYRGYCLTDVKLVEEVIVFYKWKKKDLYNVYTACQLIDEKYLNSTKKFLDGFYETLDNPKKLNAALNFPCTKKGPNYVIKGLKEQ